jgi:hypothetical protein
MPRVTACVLSADKCALDLRAPAELSGEPGMGKQIAMMRSRLAALEATYFNPVRNSAAGQGVAARVASEKWGGEWQRHASIYRPLGSPADSEHCVGTKRVLGPVRIPVKTIGSNCWQCARRRTVRMRASTAHAFSTHRTVLAPTKFSTGAAVPLYRVAVAYREVTPRTPVRCAPPVRHDTVARSPGPAGPCR